jgi:hypothetical protein
MPRRAQTSDLNIRVHSVVEPTRSKGPTSVIAFVALEESSPDADIWGAGGDDLPTLDAEVVRAPKRTRRRDKAIRYTSLSESGSLDDEVTLRGAGSHKTVLRLAPDDASLLAQGPVLHRSEQLAKPGLFVRLRGVRVDFVPDDAQPAWESAVWLPVARIHRPKHRGCKAVYSLVATSGETLEAKFAVSGLGVNGETKFAVETSQELPATSACKELSIRARCSIVFGTTYVAGRPVAYGSRILISDIDGSESRYRDLPASLDLCGWSEEKAPARGRTIERLSTASGGVDDAKTDLFAIDREVAGTMALGVEFAKVPVTLSIQYTRTSSQRTVLQTRLMPGADYLGYLPRPDNPMEKCWTVLG